MSNQHAFQAVIFDFDGVLADTIPLHFASFRELFGEEGVEFTFEDYQRVANGAPRHEVIRAVLGDGLPAAKFERVMKRKEEIVLELVERRGLAPIPGVMELVERFRDLGVRVGMASSSRTAALFLEAMGRRSLFDAVTDAKESVRSKPDPEVYLKTAGKLGVEPSRCVAVEDAALGVQAGRAAGMAVLAITTTTTAEELKGADWIVDSFDGVDAEKILGPSR